MDLLFITHTYPYPAHAGDLLVTSSLISQLARDPNIRLTVFCGNGCPSKPVLSDKIRWIRGSRKHMRLLDVASLFSIYPRAALQAISRRDASDISLLVRENSYDAIIVNISFCAPAIRQLRNADCRPKIIYLSHNAEALIRPEISRSIKNPILRLVQTVDASKYKNMENRLVRDVDGITAMSEEDVAYFVSKAEYRPVTLLKPAYSGEKVTSRNISAQTSSVVVLVGSFFWGAKQANLREILKWHKNFYAKTDGGFRLRIAGQMPEKLRKTLSQAYPDVEFTGTFGNLSEVLSDARIALVLERLGGGFKLKILDYIFHRVPILAFPEAMAGSGLIGETDYLSVRDFSNAMKRLSESIDDFTLLNNLQSSAYARADGLFNWKDRVDTLKDTIEAIKYKAGNE